MSPLIKLDWGVSAVFNFLFQKLRKTCAHLVYRFQNLCTWQPKCACLAEGRVEGAPFISITEDLRVDWVVSDGIKLESFC